MFSRLILFYLLAVVHAKQVNLESSVHGDQTVGGIHLFEIHSPSGGMGAGIKVLIAVVLIAAFLYWYIRRKLKKSVRNTLIPTLSHRIAEAAPLALPPPSHCRYHERPPPPREDRQESQRDYRLGDLS